MPDFAIVARKVKLFRGVLSERQMSMTTAVMAPGCFFTGTIAAFMKNVSAQSPSLGTV